MTAEDLARALHRHWAGIASDLGECHVRDLLDHYAGQGNPLPSKPVVDEAIALLTARNGGSPYLTP